MDLQVGLCFGINDLSTYAVSYSFENMYTLSYRRHGDFTFSYIIILMFSNRSVTRCMRSHSWPLDLCAFG